MARHQHRITLTIANGQTLSNELKGTEGKVALGTLTDATIFAPATLPETVTVLVAPTDVPAGGDYLALQVAGADVTVPANKAKQVASGLGGAKALRLSAGVGVAADRVFQLIMQLDSSLGGVI